MLVLTHTKAHLTDNKTDTKFRPHTSTINSSSSMLPSSSLVAAGQHHSQHRCVPSSAGRQAPRMAPVMRFLNKHHEDPTGKQRFPLNEGLPLSLFHPFKRLPPEGTTLPVEEEICDPEEDLCKTPLHVYEARCTVCSGTGWARAPSNGRRGHLGTCIVCHGLGYVRRTTSRFCPDDPDKHMTIARPLTWHGKFAARMSRPPSSNGRSSSGSPDGGSSSNNGSSPPGASNGNGTGSQH